jgi:hypothetical protein
VHLVTVHLLIGNDEKRHRTHSTYKRSNGGTSRHPRDGSVYFYGIPSHGQFETIIPSDIQWVDVSISNSQGVFESSRTMTRTASQYRIVLYLAVWKVPWRLAVRSEIQLQVGVSTVSNCCGEPR